MDTETKIAKITDVDYPKHSLYIYARKYQVLHVTVADSYRYEFSQVLNLKSVTEGSTTLWTCYDPQDPFNCDGKVIGGPGMSSHEWLEEQGYKVEWETPVPTS